MLMMLIAVFDPITIKTITSTTVNFENITFSFIASILDIVVEKLQCLSFQLIDKKLSRTSPVFFSEITSHFFILIYGLKITNELHQLNSDQNQSKLMMGPFMNFDFRTIFDPAFIYIQIKILYHYHNRDLSCNGVKIFQPLFIFK